MASSSQDDFETGLQMARSALMNALGQGAATAQTKLLELEHMADELQFIPDPRFRGTLEFARSQSGSPSAVHIGDVGEWVEVPKGARYVRVSAVSSPGVKPGG